MAEAAVGLVLSAVALFGSCVTGYELLTTYRSVEKDAALLLCQLEIEERRFALWGKNVGLDNATCLVSAADLGAVIGVMKQIKSITSDTEGLKSRYGMKDVKATEDPKDIRTDGAETYLQSGDLLTEFDRRMKAPSQRIATRRRFRWVFKRKDFEKLIDDLRKLNDGLNHLLAQNQKLKQHFLDDFTALCLQSTASNNMETLITIREAAKNVYPSWSLTTDQRIRSLTLSRQVQIGQVALEDPVPMIELELLSNDSDEQRTIARFKDKTILVEWRYCTGLEPMQVEELKLRLASLATLLCKTLKPVEFHVLDCVGYCHDKSSSRFGLLSNIPLTKNGELPEITTLEDLLHTEKNKERVLPSLNERFTMCATLANSMAYLHSANWLYRDFRSSCVLLIQEGNHYRGGWKCFLSGLTYARPHDAEAMSLPFAERAARWYYQHPDLISEPTRGYRKAFDAFSLGVVLVEIGFWRPITAFHKHQYSERQNLSRLLKNQLHGDLAHRMGDSFEDAVRLLLTDKVYAEVLAEGDQLVDFLRRVVTRVGVGTLLENASDSRG